jgi:hypothetical protein
MKTKVLLLVVLSTVGVAGAIWLYSQPHSPMQNAAGSGRKILYYQSAMHPWIKSDKPGKCPICGMDLVPVYAGDAGMEHGRRRHTEIEQHHRAERPDRDRRATTAGADAARRRHASSRVRGRWRGLNFTAYERDLAWLKIGQTVEVNVPSAPGKSFSGANHRARHAQRVADADFDPATG